MSDDHVPMEGSVATVERTFTREEVAQFAELSRDHGTHHLEPDEDDRVLVHGLLLATLPTEVGGQRDVLARTMSYEFHRPVYSGQLVTCQVQTDEVIEHDDRWDITSTATCTVDGATVMSAEYSGAIMKTDTGL
ncbi:MAG: dehydratase [Salinirussus sp.]